MSPAGARTTGKIHEFSPGAHGLYSQVDGICIKSRKKSVFSVPCLLFEKIVLMG